MDISIRINHMYSKSLNIYGDLGNIIALKHVAEQRGIKVEAVNTELEQEIIESDIYFIGGGQDKDQVLVYQDLLTHKDFIINEVKKGKVFLLICGGYQLFGKHFVDGQGNLIEGLGILELETKAPDASVSSRCIGNIVVELTQSFIEHWKIDTNFSKYIVGFENHGGQTVFLSDTVQPIGNVIKGFGNNLTDKLEGAAFMHIIGSYCHGSMLPKNPHLTDALLRVPVENKYGPLEWPHLQFDVEKQAHDYILAKDS